MSGGRCGEPHPDDAEALCIRSEGRHVQHSARDGRAWRNENVARQEEMRTGPGGALRLAREVASRVERPLRAR